MNSIHKIKSITFKNYRAFYGEYKEIELNGKNLLVWGENGSGKSSFCKSLQDFVLSINNDSHQKNIFSNPDDDWSVKFKIDDESSPVNFSSENIVDKDYIKYCATALPFLDYRKVLSLYFSPDSKDGELNLFGIFEKLLENFPVKSEYGKSLKELKEKSAYIDDDLSEDEKLKEKQKEKQRYVNIIDDLLNNQLKDNIVEILKYFKLDLDLKGFIVEQDKIYIKTSVFGEQIEEKYHEFLNEARLSALSISVYFAAIKTLLDTQIDVLNILVLDDMLIGLDMGNRMAIFDIIKKHFPNTQIFFFTYDKAWFETFKDKVDDNDWISLEMYAQSVNENGKTFERPFLKIAQNDWLRAREELYENFNYDSCGNLLRKELEKQIDHYLSIDRNNLEQKIYLAMLKSRFKLNYDLSTKIEKRIEKIRMELTPTVNLDGKLKSIEGIIKKFRAKNTIFEENTINEIKNSVLNPASHKDLKPLYKQELKKAFDEIVKLMNENGIEFDLGNKREEVMEEVVDSPQNIPNLNILDKGKIFKFNSAVVQDLKDAGAERYLNDGYFELIMKPVEKKKIFYSTAEIIDYFKPIKISFDDIFPVVGGLKYDQDDVSINYSIESDERHSLYITKDWGYEIFSAFTDGFFILRKSYPKNRRFLDRSHVVFPDIVGFVTKSLMLAKQFYSERLGKDEKIYFEWRLTETKDRELVPPDRNWRFGGICNINEIIEKRVYRYEKLGGYIEISKEVIGEICKQFGWMNGIAYVGEFNKDFIEYFDPIESSGIMDMGTATGTVQVWDPNDPKNEEIAEKILELIKNDSNISDSSIAEKTGIDIFVIQHLIEKMKDENKIRYIEYDKGGHWEIVEEE